MAAGLAMATHTPLTVYMNMPLVELLEWHSIVDEIYKQAKKDAERGRD